MSPEISKLRYSAIPKIFIGYFSLIEAKFTTITITVYNYVYVCVCIYMVTFKSTYKAQHSATGSNF